MYRQAWGLGAGSCSAQRPPARQSETDELALQLSDGTIVRSAAVVVATGASYRRLVRPASMS